MDKRDYHVSDEIVTAHWRQVTYAENDQNLARRNSTIDPVIRVEVK